MPVRAVRKREKRKRGAPAAPSALVLRTNTPPPSEEEPEITKLVSVWFKKNAAPQKEGFLAKMRRLAEERQKMMDEAKRMQQKRKK